MIKKCLYVSLLLSWTVVLYALLFPSFVLAQEETNTALDPVAATAGSGLTIHPENKKISIDYEGASLVSVLKALSYSFNLNMVMTKDVEGKVSAHLQDITIDQALDAILSVNGYRFTRKKDIIYVMRASDVETIVQPFHLSFLLAADAKQLLSKAISSQGDIQINEATNSLVIVDTQEHIEKIRQVLSEVDVPPIQVLIEAKIVDIQSKDFENLGTTLDATYDPKGALGGGLFNRSSSADESLAVNTNMAGPSTDIAGGQLNITPTFKSLSVDIQVDALIQKNRAHVLASPSIATLNGKEAKIIIGERFPFLETTQTASGNTQTTRFVDVGTTLKVTPMVSPDGWIVMKVHPEVSFVAASLSAGPRITTREADATIRVRDNETIIIGGLINKKDDRVKSGVPVLRSIPLLGWAFSRKSSSREDTELIVFITPHIIRASSLANDSSLKVKALENPDYANKGDKFIQDSMFSYVQNLESEFSKIKPEEADLFKYSEIVQAYQVLYRQFPDSPQADFCLFKIAQIYHSVFSKPEAATKAINELLEKFPNSPYRSDAEKMFKKEHSL
jgi:type II secretory pathway component GspD/PulD (secretin)